MNRVLWWMKQAGSAIKTIFSMPDYQKYLQHHAIAHPGQKPMTEEEYYLYALKNRYESGSVNRCC